MVLLATFVVGGVLVPAVHAVHHAGSADTATHTHVVQDDANGGMDCTLCEVVFQSANALVTAAPAPALRIEAMPCFQPDAPRLHSVAHPIIRGPPLT